MPPEWLTESVFGLVLSVLGAGPSQGIDDTIGAIASVFLDGSRAHDSP